jgi:hypothetical protein
VMPEKPLTIQDPLHGGYVGVQVDQSSVFALFESEPAADGTVRVQVHRAAIASGASAGEPKILYDLAIDPRLSQVSLLGVVDGFALLSRIDYDTKTTGVASVRSSSLMVVSPDGKLRVLGDYARDYPLPGIRSDATRVYWLTRFGKLFGLPRAGLR